MTPKTILLIGTLDTKGDEYAYVRGLIERRGHRVLLMDAGVFPRPSSSSSLAAEVGAARVAGAGAKVVTYCRTGGQAAHTYFTAKYLGYDVVMYDGSFFEWSNAAGTPVVTGGERK